MSIRSAVFAGSFYPAAQDELRRVVSALLDGAGEGAPAPPRALVAPHAGYVYSGPVAAAAFVRLRNHRGAFDRVVLLGPSHYVRVLGLALPKPDVTGFATPLGVVPLEPGIAELLDDLPQVVRANSPHLREHSLEVELPFLQLALGDFQLIPLSVGEATPQEVAEVISRLDGPRTLTVVSTDLSHHNPYEEARQLDGRTSAAIEDLDFEAIGDAAACGRVPLRGLLAWARAGGLVCRRLALCNSGDTSGSLARVVGYGAYELA